MAKLYFYFASMNAGKSTTLLQAAFNYGERDMRVSLWTAAVDDRPGFGAISSRIGLAADANRFDTDTEIAAHVLAEHARDPLACVLLDEAQFLTPEQVWQLAGLVDRHNLPVVCYGLRTDFRGELFPGSGVLLGIADEFSELKGVCHCGRKATMNQRVDEAGQPVIEGAQTEIGGNERYVAVCRRHFVMTPPAPR